MRFILFLLFPALELYLLVKAGSALGALNIVLWVFASAFLGIWAVRAQGQSAMQKARAELEAGRVPETPFLDGLLLFLGGILLLLPGLITDAAGLLLLIPPVRRWSALGLASFIKRRQAAGASASRVFFFSTGFGPGQSSPRQSAPRQSTHDHPFQESIRHQPPLENDEPPRTVTIIESTAIEIDPSPCAKDDPASEKKD